MACVLIKGCSTLKRQAVAYTDFGMLDDYRLLTTETGFRVHVERRERNGTISEAVLYDGASLDAANALYNKLIGNSV